MIFCFIAYEGGEVDQNRKTTLVKAAKSRTGAKCKISGSRRSNQASRNVTHNDSIDDLTQRITKTNFATLYVFPSFDKSDSLIYLPTTLSRHLNAGDMKAMGKLLTSHLDKNCTVDMSFFETGQLNVKYLIKAYELLSDLHPDMIACATNITVDGNSIKATMHAKFTDIKLIHESMRASVTDPVFAPILRKDRIEGMREELQRDNRPQEEVEHFLALAAREDNLLVYINMTLEMSIDDLTKKVSQFSMSGRVTSMHPVTTDTTAEH